MPCSTPRGLPASSGGWPLQATERADMSARTPPPCPCCAGYGVPLGTLGRLHWFRCRDCGMPFGRAKRVRQMPESHSTPGEVHHGVTIRRAPAPAGRAVGHLVDPASDNPGTTASSHNTLSSCPMVCWLDDEDHPEKLVLPYRASRHQGRRSVSFLTANVLRRSQSEVRDAGGAPGARAFEPMCFGRD